MNERERVKSGGLLDPTVSIGRIAGVRIGFNWSWLIVFALIVWSLAASYFPSRYPLLSGSAYLAMAVLAATLSFGSLLLHELGHAVQARREGMQIDGITLWLFGGVARFKAMFPSAGAEFRIALAGPLVTLVLSGAFAALAALVPTSLALHGVLAWLGYVNLLLLVFNLIPALPLDGGRVLRSLLWQAKGNFGWATVLAADVARGFGYLLIGGGLTLFLFSGAFTGVWFALIGWCLLTAAGAERRYGAARDALAGLRVGDLMVRSPVTADPDQTVATFMDETAGSMLPPTALPVLSEDDALADAFAELGEAAHRRGVVLRDGDLAGLLSLTDIERCWHNAPQTRPAAPRHHSRARADRRAIRDRGAGLMKLVRHIHVRGALIALVALVVIGSGAAYAATRTAARPIGTGVVVIDTNLAYQGASAAGTGIVLTSSGEILTNNHVIAGATTIRVVVPNTTHTYTARVVGYDTTADVAVLQLQNASNLKTVTIGDASKLTLGAHVTAVGNAGGTGTLTSANGTVTGLNKSITAQSDSGAAERLSGLIETDAALQPGDSGGPLLNSAGRVVGMDTAASSSSPFTASGSSDGYAIPIAKALTISKQIVSGKASATVHVGATAFLGVQVADVPSSPFEGATVVGVVAGGPADAAGLLPGDVITAVDGKTVTSASGLEPIVLASKPGTKVTITYTDTSGRSQTATVTLGSGPPQ